MARFRSFRMNAPRWWQRVLLSLVAAVLLLAFFFFAIFALIAFAVLGVAWTIYLWWRGRERNAAVRKDIFTRNYRVLGDDSEVLSNKKDERN